VAVILEMPKPRQAKMQSAYAAWTDQREVTRVWCTIWAQKIFVTTSTTSRTSSAEREASWVIQNKRHQQSGFWHTQVTRGKQVPLGFLLRYKKRQP